MSKRLKKARELLECDKKYTVNESLNILSLYKAQCAAKFNETVDIVVKLGIDTKHSDQMVRSTALMPSGLGKEIKVALITSENELELAENCGADTVGSSDFIEEIKGGALHFDIYAATQSIMPKVAMLGKILGPKGLMPNPKLGTVANIKEVKSMIERLKSGQVAYKAEKEGIIHAGIGKLDFEKDALSKNIASFFESVLSAKPKAAQGTYVRYACLSTSQGISIPLDLNSVLR